MIGKTKIILGLLILVLIGGCTNRASEFYTPHFKTTKLEKLKSDDRYIFLQNGEEPIYLDTAYDNFNNAKQKLADKGFFSIGASSWSGRAEDTKSDIIQHAKDIGAVVILYTLKSLGTHTYEGTNVSTVYHSDGTQSKIYTPATKSYTRFEFLAIYLAKRKR